MEPEASRQEHYLKIRWAGVQHAIGQRVDPRRHLAGEVGEYGQSWNAANHKV